MAADRGRGDDGVGRGDGFPSRCVLRSRSPASRSPPRHFSPRRSDYHYDPPSEILHPLHPMSALHYGNRGSPYEEDWDPFDLWRDCLRLALPQVPPWWPPVSRPYEHPCDFRPPLVHYSELHGSRHHACPSERSLASDRGYRDCGDAMRQRQGSRSPARSDGDSARHAAADWQARHLCITVENIPEDMTWMELKNVGRVYGFVAHACTLREGAAMVGVLKFSRPEDVDRARAALDGQAMEGSRRALRVYLGAPSDVMVPMESRRGKRCGS